MDMLRIHVYYKKAMSITLSYHIGISIQICLANQTMKLHFLFQIPNLGLLELASQPDTCLYRDEEMAFAAGGLTLAPMEPMKTWKLTFTADTHTLKYNKDWKIAGFPCITMKPFQYGKLISMFNLHHRRRSIRKFSYSILNAQYSRSTRIYSKKIFKVQKYVNFRRIKNIHCILLPVIAYEKLNSYRYE